MDDNKDKAGVLPGGDANKRTPPTIELTASEVSESPVRAGDAGRRCWRAEAGSIRAVFRCVC